MKQFEPYFITLSLLSAAMIAQAGALELGNDADRINYSVGYQIGSDFRIQQFELHPDAVLKGIEDAMSGAEPALNAQQRTEIMRALGKKVAERKQQQREQVAQAAADTLDPNQAFLVTNAQRPGVVTTASGLQYRIIEAGTGEHPGPDNQVMVQYRGRLIDGTEFDSSYKRNRPATFKVGQVIKGWSEALQLMPRGSKWELVIPPELGYGAQGVGDTIPPNSTLIFDVYLISIN